MASDPKTYWNDLYQQKPFAKGKEPSAFLHQMLPRLQKGKVLDIAMGEGVNSVYLAQKGFQVVGFDISDVAIEHAQQLAKDTGVAIHARQADLDLYLMGVMEYDSIVMTYFRPTVPRYYSAMISALKQGGTLLIESYSVAEIQEAIDKKEGHKNYFFSSNEILKPLSELRLLYYQEGLVDGKHVVQCLAQKPVDKHAAKYDVFGMHTKGKNIQDSSKHLELAEKLFKK